jgi:C-terminal processing protease CtpA/Prc
VTLNSGSYDKSPVAHHEVITIEDKKIGYIVYTGFNSEYDEELIEAVRELKEDGAEEVILDLRINSGGSVNSAVTLCSALMPATFEEATLCKIVRNPKNEKMEKESYFNLKDTGSLFELDKLTVICSGYSASASELVVMGLRGLDVPVTLIGSKTEGKNCGMDVTRRTIEGVSVEFAPITFMCFNAKGFGDWGEGIEPDIDLTEEGNELSISDKNYPLPRADWGDCQHDIALAAALAKVTGKKVSDSTRSAVLVELPVAAYMEYEIEGIRHYVEER